MRRTKSWRNRWHRWTLARRLVAPAGLGGGGLLISGCFAAAGVGGAVAVGLLTGFFLTRLQASFAATAHSYGYQSYGYDESGDARLWFNTPGRGHPSLTRFGGRLPGFHMVIININDKAMDSAQQGNGANDEAVVFETEADIDFDASPPVISGRVRELGQDDWVDLQEFYPAITDPAITSVSAEIGDRDARGRYTVRVNIQTRTDDGEELDYTLVMRVRVSANGNTISGSVEVERVLTLPNSQEITIESTAGDIEGTQETDDQEYVIDQDQGGNENAAEEPDEGNENAEDDEPANDNVADEEEEPANANEAEEEPELIEPDSCPGLPAVAVPLLNDIILDLGVDGFDLDGDGSVTAQEVQEVINPSIAPFAITEEAAACVAVIING